MVLEHYLDVGGVDGEASAPDTKNQIRLRGWTMGLDRPQGQSAEIADFVATKFVDSSSPLLMTMCAEGRVSPQVKLMMRAVGQTNPRLLVDLRDVMVRSVSIETDADSEPIERVVLSFERLWFGTSRVDRGTTTEDRTWFAWDLQQNQPAT